MTTLWIIIWILCCLMSPEIKRIMLAKNLVLHSVKSHRSKSDCHDDVPRTLRCFDRKTWQQTGSRGDSLNSALPSEPEMNWCPSSAVWSLVFVLFLWELYPSVFIILLHSTFSKGKLVFLLLVCRFNIKIPTPGCIFTELAGEINHLCKLYPSVKFGHNETTDPKLVEKVRL